MTQPLLSICIPTYNREYLIGECLGKICPAAAKYGVEVVVSDNASTDGTEAIIRDYASRYDNLVYVRQSENIGPDANFESVLRAATGKYRWLMGDGCFVEEETVEKLLPYLNGTFDVVVVNSGDRDRMGYSEDKIYTDPEELLREIGWHMTWLSCLIYSENLVMTANFRRFYNSNFLQTGGIFEYFVNHACKVLALPKVLVDNFNIQKKNSWQNELFRIFGRNWYVFVMSLPVMYSAETKKKCLQKNSILSTFFTYGGLLNFRKAGLINYTQYKEYRFYLQQVVPYPAWIIGVICCLPEKMITDRLIYFVVKGRVMKLFKNGFIRKIFNINPL